MSSRGETVLGRADDHSYVRCAMFEFRNVRGVEAVDICAEILGELPTWFGIPEANADYAATAGAKGSLVASDGSHPVGITTVVRHFPSAAEVHLMAVRPAWHRRGVGAAMIRRIEADLATGGVRFLQVKTLSPAHPDPGYALTRAFYLALGFEPLEEFADLWGPHNPALQLVKSLPPV